jgi:hypothetical protein
LLPQGYYALGEQRSGDIGPDVLTLHSDTFGEGLQPGPAAGESGMIAVLREGFHLLVVDLFPPTRHDPDGVHGLIWEYLTAESWPLTLGLPLTLASYCAKTPITAYVEPTCVGGILPDMPLFLTPEHYINVPLENTYMAAWRGVPERWRRVIESAT